MRIEDIKQNWIVLNHDPESDVQLWDSQADDPTYQNTYDSFIEFLQSEGMIDKSFDVLDVGCGAGAYSLALASETKSVTGVDISPNMLANAKAKAEQMGLCNVSFMLLDWYDVILDDLDMTGKYDLVFAHNSPAICSFDTFEKLDAASRRYCAVCTPISMQEPVLQAVQQIAGIEDPNGGCDAGFSYMLDVLLHKGYMPKLRYEKQVWPMHQSFEEACSYYIGRTSMMRPLSEDVIEAIKEYLRSQLVDGVVSDEIKTTVATMYWGKAI